MFGISLPELRPHVPAYSAWRMQEAGGLGSPPYGSGVRQARGMDFQVRPGVRDDLGLGCA